MKVQGNVFQGIEVILLTKLMANVHSLFDFVLQVGNTESQSLSKVALNLGQIRI